MRLNDYYQDRGIQKFNGFFLSEHTSELSKEQQLSNQVIPGKEPMSEALIFETLNRAIIKTKQVAIQLNMKDVEGNFLEDIVGSVRGFDDSSIYLDDIAVPFTRIRHIAEIDTHRKYEE